MNYKLQYLTIPYTCDRPDGTNGFPTCEVPLGDQPLLAVCWFEKNSEKSEKSFLMRHALSHIDGII